MTPTTTLAIRRIGELHDFAADDVLAVEEPLEIRIADRPLTVTMRTPGDDFNLAAGFLFTEGVIDGPTSIDTIRHWGSPNVVRVGLQKDVTLDWERLQRNFYTASSCGVCGKSSIDAVRVRTRPVSSDAMLHARTLASFPDLLRKAQPLFISTGGIHAAGLFSTEGHLLALAEDVGRHNAVDKVIGAMFLGDRTPLTDSVLLVSGRVSFEIVQKAVVAGIPIVAAVGAPSSVAVELAREMGVTLAGFVREGRCNVYAGADRIVT